MNKNGLLCLSVLVLAGACVSRPTEDEREDWRYRRDVARIEAREEFERLKEQCARSRGVVVVDRQFSRRARPTPEDLKLATCMPAGAAAVY